MLGGQVLVLALLGLICAPVDEGASTTDLTNGVAKDLMEKLQCKECALILYWEEAGSPHMLQEEKDARWQEP